MNRDVISRLVSRTVDAAISRIEQPRWLPATVVAVPNVSTCSVVIDGDTQARDAHPGGWVIAAGDRVMVLFYPPRGVMVVARLGAVAITPGTGSSGVYTPTRSAEANLDGNVTLTEAQWLSVGTTVTVSGRFTANPTLTATATSFEISLPVASNFGAVEDAAGTAACGGIAGMCAEVIAVPANDTMQIQWIASDITSKTWSFIASYEVI